ncbi:hypothetical protein ACFOEE_00610 [Pseudoalteromonas fenneropenaei]|uniref:Bacteriocin n=1 Tax=Pseudoalteromonas fenneropenaei TaxID=1737459 RepID=A0ABV7CCK7_9GAMM
MKLSLKKQQLKSLSKQVVEHGATKQINGGATPVITARNYCGTGNQAFCTADYC